MTAPISSEQKTNSEPKSKFHLPIQKNSLILALFAIACTATVGIVHELTKAEIKVQAQQQLLATLHSIIEPSSHDNDITKDCVNYSPMSESDNNTNMETAYIARKANEAVTIAMTNTAPDGYNGDINIIVAINMADESISGVRVLSHKETPGLGDKIELRKSDWITSFTAKTIFSANDKRWAVSKDDGMFDQFTGATITPRAVVNSVKQTLLYFKDNKHALLTRPNVCLAENAIADKNSED